MSQAVNVKIDVLEPQSVLPKYHPDGPFADPLIRCNNCGEIDLTAKWVKRGHCLKCGNRRCRSVINMTEIDRAKAIAWGVDSDFLALFEAVADEQY